MFEEAKFLVSLLAKVAKSDGRVNELEARLISETLDDITLRLGNDVAMRSELKQIYNREKETVHNAYFIARQYKIASALVKTPRREAIFFTKFGLYRRRI